MQNVGGGALDDPFAIIVVFRDVQGLSPTYFVVHFLCHCEVCIAILRMTDKRMSLQ